MTKASRFAAVIALGLTAFGLLAPAAGAFDWGTNEFNMNTNPTAGAYAVLTIGAMQDRPWFLGFSEVCNLSGNNPSNMNDMADWIESHLGPLGYATAQSNYLYMSYASSACRDANGVPRGFGVLAYTRGVGVGSTKKYFTSPAGGYDEGAICAEASTYLGSIVSCSTHLYNGSGPTGQAQAEELRTYASQTYPGVKKVLIGDFNLRPPGHGETPVPSPYYTNYFEADQNQNRPTRNTGIKNDFMFGAKNAFPHNHGASDPVATSYSDHYYYKGYFRS